MTAADGWPTRDLLAHRAATTPRQTAVVDAADGATWSVADLDARAGALAARLPADVGPGDRVALLSGTRPAVATLLWAVRRRGASLVPLNVRLARSELQERLDRADPACVVCTAATAADAVAVTDRPTYSLDRTTSPDGSGGSVPALREIPETTRDPVGAGPGDEALVLFTSGTTGRPKGVRLTVRNLVWSAIGSALRLGVGADDRWLCCLPTYHTGGIAPLVRSVVQGTTVVIRRDFEAAATAAALEAHAATGVSLVPTMLTRLLDAGWEPADRLRTVLVGGAPTPRSLVERAREAGVPLYPTYGMTEAASQVATARPTDLAADPETVGHPLFPTTVTVLGEDGTPVEAGTRGELAVAGPTVSPGYLSDDATDAGTDRGPWGLRTGDLGIRDEAGRLRVVGRVDDLITTGGETVAPAAVASVLRDHPRVADAAVVGVPDEEWGERVGALVVPSTDPGVDEEEEAGTVEAAPEAEALEAHCRERLAGFELPRRWAVAEELPRTASGTVDRTAVRRRLVGDDRV